MEEGVTLNGVRYVRSDQWRRKTQGGWVPVTDHKLVQELDSMVAYINRKCGRDMADSAK